MKSTRDVDNLSQSHPIVLFDGVCHLCQGSVRFILKRDPQAYFRFASLQSTAAQALLSTYGIEVHEPYDSILLIEDGKVYRESTAMLRILRRCHRAWSLLYGLILVPPFIRNAVYRWVGRHRYQWFGRSDQCMLPDEKWRDRFIPD